MRKRAARLWSGIVFLGEFIGAILLGVPVGVFVGLAIAAFVYFITFRALVQSLAAMWRKRAAIVAART